MANYLKKYYIDQEQVEYTVSPEAIDSAEELDFVFIQTKGSCRARITVDPKANGKSKIRIKIFAENTASVDCVCSLNVLVPGSVTDIQIRSWPFDRSKIQARPEMRIHNSNVVATHGNALGSLKTSEQYYLATKGINDYKELVKQSLLNDEI
jgi:hypothetical protein